MDDNKSLTAVWEFYSPFAHVSGRYEWCRIHSPTHGSFDAFIVLGASTAVPPVVYVNSPEGAAFMADRYPESAAFRVPPGSLAIEALDQGCRVRGTLRAGAGPVREADMTLTAPAGETPRAVPYGGDRVWGSRWTCEGVDLAREGRCDGRILWADARGEELLEKIPCVVTAGSFGRLTEREAGAYRSRPKISR